MRYSVLPAACRNGGPLTTLLMVFCVAAGGVAAPTGGDRPNIVVILADDKC